MPSWRPVERCPLRELGWVPEERRAWTSHVAVEAAADAAVVAAVAAAVAGAEVVVGLGDSGLGATLARAGPHWSPVLIEAHARQRGAEVVEAARPPPPPR